MQWSYWASLYHCTRCDLTEHHLARANLLYGRRSPNSNINYYDWQVFFAKSISSFPTLIFRCSCFSMAKQVPTLEGKHIMLLLSISRNSFQLFSFLEFQSLAIMSVGFWIVLVVLQHVCDCTDYSETSQPTRRMCRTSHKCSGCIWVTKAQLTGLTMLHIVYRWSLISSVVVVYSLVIRSFCLTLCLLPKHTWVGEWLLSYT